MMNTKYFMLLTFIFFLTVTACKEDEGFLTAEGTDAEGNTMTTLEEFESAGNSFSDNAFGEVSIN